MKDKGDCHTAKSEHFSSEKSTCTCNNNNQYFVRMGMPKSGIVTMIAYLFTLHIRALVVVPCGGPKKSPRTFI